MSHRIAVATAFVLTLLCVSNAGAKVLVPCQLLNPGERQELGVTCSKGWPPGDIAPALEAANQKNAANSTFAAATPLPEPPTLAPAPPRFFYDHG